MAEQDNPWIDWHPGPRPVPVGTIVRLKFRNDVVSNPILVTDSKAISWDHPVTVRFVRLSRNLSWLICAYQIVSLPKDNNGT